MHRRVTVVGSVCLCVCVSVKSHLTSGASVCPENTVMYSAGNGGQKIAFFVCLEVTIYATVVSLFSTRVVQCVIVDGY